MIYYNTEAIFNVIGDYPVVDQFDVLYSNLMSGSTYDNYVTGSLLTVARTTDGRPTYITGERGLIFSKLGVDRASFPNPNATGAKYTDDSNQSYNLQPWRERAGTIRNVRLFSSTERFYDSMTPGISQMLSAIGGEGITEIAGGFFTLYFGGSSSSNDKFLQFFPFHPIFSQVKRTKRLATSFLLSLPLNRRGTIVPGFYIFYKVTSIDPYWTTGGGSGLLSENDIIKIVFGIGDSPPILLDGGNYAKNIPKERLNIGVGAKQLLSPIVRGWKYGLIDGNPHYSSAIFRRDRYGQVRDMLEQRLNAAYVDDEDNSPFRYLGSFETPALPPPDPVGSSLTERQRGFSDALSALQNAENLRSVPPVRVNFTRQTYLESTKELLYFSEKPENTWSSNLSQYATSSLPYIDDVPTNRNELTFTPSAVVLSSLADVFGNQIIGG